MVKIIKTNETKISLTQKELYMDIDKICMEKLKVRFEGKCYNSGLILEVLEIINRSSVYINNDDPKLSGIINVQFKTKSISYPEKSVIFIKISSITGDDIRGHSLSNHVAATLRANNYMSNLKKDQIIPLIITSIKYKPGQNEIECYGCEFNYWFDTNRKAISVFFWPNLIFKVQLLSSMIYNNPNYTPVEVLNRIKIILKQFIDEIKKEEQKYNEFKKKNKKEIEYFENIININHTGPNVKKILDTRSSNSNKMKSSTYYFNSKGKTQSITNYLETYLNNLPSEKEVLSSSKNVDKVNTGNMSRYINEFISKPFISPNFENEISIFDAKSFKSNDLSAFIREDDILHIASMFKNNLVSSMKLVRKMAKHYSGDALKQNSSVFTILDIHKAKLIDKIQF